MRLKGQRGQLSTSHNDLGVELEWSIRDFWSLSHDDGDCYRSTLSHFRGHCWWLLIYPNGDSSRDTLGHMDILLSRDSLSELGNMSVSLITADRGKSHERHAAKKFRPWNMHAFNRIISKLELQERRAELTPSGVLTVALTLKWTTPTGSEGRAECCYCRGTFEADSISSHRKKCMQRPTKCPNCSEVVVLQKWLEEHDCGKERAEGMNSPERPPKRQKILQDYKQMFLNQHNCDIVLKVGEREFPAHKSILGARSPVFFSMFQHNMKENKTRNVDIEDCDASSFSDFLCYLYCEDASSLSQENVFSLFKAADKYDVPDLRMKCLEFMRESLSVDSFCKTITLALLHTETKLIHAASEFFVKNAENIVETAEWQTFNAENPIQGNELFVKFMKSDRCVKP